MFYMLKNVSLKSIKYATKIPVKFEMELIKNIDTYSPHLHKANNKGNAHA